MIKNQKKQMYKPIILLTITGIVATTTLVYFNHHKSPKSSRLFVLNSEYLNQYTDLNPEELKAIYQATQALQRKKNFNHVPYIDESSVDWRAKAVT